MRTLIPVGLALLTLACAGVMKTETPFEPGVPDDQIGLSKVDILEVSSPEPVADNTSDPGERPLRPRIYPGSPPLIPHGVDGYLPITRDENLCLTCHQLDEAGEGEPTPIPESHYTDLRNAPSEVGGEPVGARYNCTTCHVTETGASMLVGSSFDN